MKFCVDCGTALPENCSRLKVRCVACQKKHVRLLSKENNARKREEARLLYEKKQKNNLAVIQRAASEKRMSYGEYVAKYGGTT